MIYASQLKTKQSLHPGSSLSWVSVRPLLLLFLGDSLVSGVGGQATSASWYARGGCGAVTVKASGEPVPAALPRRAVRVQPEQQVFVSACRERNVAAHLAQHLGEAKRMRPVSIRGL